MPNTLSDTDWKILLSRIKRGECTPFLGAGACYGVLPLGGEIAKEWAKREDYPLKDDEDLVRVAQFLAVKYDSFFPKAEILQRFADAPPPDFRDPDEPHRVLAGLPLPIYLTTNYDDFLFRALKRQHKEPRREMCRWNSLIQNCPEAPSVFDTEPGYAPNVANPLVFHFHGHSIPASIVLTEDDYLEFLAAMSREASLLPPRVESALTSATCLFIGYRLADWNFRVLFQGLRPTITRQKHMSVAVMPAPGGSPTEQQRAVEYLDRYYEALSLKVYWGTAREFCAELRRRWESIADQ